MDLFTVMATHVLDCEKLLYFFCDHLSVKWMKDETYQHLNTNYFSNFAEGCEEFEPTHTSSLDCLKKWMMG